MQELQRVLADFRRDGRELCDVPVFDERAFLLGKYDDGVVLKFRGIIRDVFDPELVVLSEGDQDMGIANAYGEEVSEKFVERVPLKVALVPHVTEWASARFHQSQTASSSATRTVENAVAKGTKRSNEHIDTQDEAMEDATTKESTLDASKKVKPESSETSSNKEDTTANGAAFTEAVVSIYVYDKQYSELALDAFKVNESFEFIGVLDMMVMASGGSAVRYDDGFTAQSIAELTISDCLHDIQRKQQSSVVLHCCTALKLDAINFVQPHKRRAHLASNNDRREALTATWTETATYTMEIADVRSIVIHHLAAAMGGDKLAAEYTLLCVLSRVYSRPDNTTALGSLSVNLSFSKNTSTADEQATVDRVQSTLVQLVPMLASVDMSIESLNETKFLPYKDYENDVLKGGQLQFAQGTAVLVNETVLSAGTLNEQGVKNVGALQSLVSKMLLSYDFQYYSMDFPQDVSVLSFSHGKSILPVHVSVPLSPATECDQADVNIECLRLFLALLRSLEVRLGNEQAELAEKHYVTCRKAKQEVSADDLHRWLRLARLVALSKGHDDVSTDDWNHMLQLEEQRIARQDERAES